MRLRMKTANYIAGAAGITTGLAIVALAFVQKLDFVKKGLPGPGFFPILCGVLIAVCSAFLIGGNYLRLKKAQEKAVLDGALEKDLYSSKEVKNLIVVIGLSALVIFVTRWAGLLPATAVAVAAMVRLLGEEGWIRSIAIGIGTFAVLYLIFGLFLEVPLPWGLLAR